MFDEARGRIPVDPVTRAGVQTQQYLLGQRPSDRRQHDRRARRGEYLTVEGQDVGVQRNVDLGKAVNEAPGVGRPQCRDERREVDRIVLENAHVGIVDGDRKHLARKREHIVVDANVDTNIARRR